LLRPIEGTRIVVADDEADSRALIRRILTRAGAKVTTAPPFGRHSGLQAHSSGRCRDRHRHAGTAARPNGGQRTLAVAVTAYAGSGNKERMLAAGFEAHVSKPMSAAKLLVVVENS
jgi:CheY-like chemotaxis protein